MATSDRSCHIRNIHIPNMKTMPLMVKKLLPNVKFFNGQMVGRTE